MSQLASDLPVARFDTTPVRVNSSISVYSLLIVRI